MASQKHLIAHRLDNTTKYKNKTKKKRVILSPTEGKRNSKKKGMEEKERNSVIRTWRRKNF